MSALSILIFALFCFSSLPLDGYQVQTSSSATEASSDRIHYHAFANRFEETLKNHPPVADCQVDLLENEFENYVDQIEIAVQINREALLNFLHLEHKITFVSQNDQDRYLTAFKQSIHNAASEIFSDIKHQAIKVSLTFSE